jgi:hypothetical protein
MRNIGEKKSRLKEGIKVGRKPRVQIVFPIIYLERERERERDREFLAALLV